MARPLVPSSQKALLLELKGLQEEPVEGFRVTLVDEGDLYNWEVAIFGPPNTYYEGGYFKARLKFPIDYPYSPPAFRFLTKMWHPNIYETGDVCISILHPPVDDPQSGELPSERWNPTQNVRTILLSVISLLNEPNTFSPANVDASVMYRKWKESKGKDREYTDIIRTQEHPGHLPSCTRWYLVSWGHLGAASWCWAVSALSSHGGRAPCGLLGSGLQAPAGLWRSQGSCPGRPSGADVLGGPGPVVSPGPGGWLLGPVLPGHLPEAPPP
ncbi:ubiquitin-conjugating enzyme E2 R1 isoform X1 [Homo sapiens]|uniref:ubiquitin-conjugating enzyme E2 R1 isoform X1 n=1 Tax=Homo sapiens TaxID=9606 RepID=UPI000387D279|nr:ubiquitin-conjugating enzyme E2 R1 isoform X1 [Homo sapiens]|eukprot:XP_005259747.1 ubiquitin-conjugating enzyme E2 R1 isoform X1 [Homo sapiens]